MIRKILIGLLIVLVLLQFYRPERNINANPQPNDISKVYATSADVETILNKACNDCHSNNTRYPWYAEIQPVRWWLDDHISEGKRELNFNEFASYNLRRQYHKLDEVAEQVEKGEMPLKSYLLIHTDAKLTDVEKKTLTGWAQGIRNTMKARYPVDSLERKKPQG